MSNLVFYVVGGYCALVAGMLSAVFYNYKDDIIHSLIPDSKKIKDIEMDTLDKNGVYVDDNLINNRNYNSDENNMKKDNIKKIEFYNTIYQNYNPSIRKNNNKNDIFQWVRY